MPKESHLEFKVGLFMLVALAGLTAFIFSISDSSVFEKGKTVRVVFGFANGVKKSAPVRIAGVDEGIVKDVHLFFDRQEGRTKVEMILWIKSGTQLSVDSVVTVNQLGMMGEKYIEITPGDNLKEFFGDEDVIIGKDPIAQEAISQRVMDVSNKLEDAIGGVNKIIQNEKNIESIGATLENFSFMTDGLNDIIADMRNGKGTVGKLLYDDRLYEDLEGLTADLKENPWKLLYRPKKGRREQK